MPVLDFFGSKWDSSRLLVTLPTELCSSCFRFSVSFLEMLSTTRLAVSCHEDLVLGSCECVADSFVTSLILNMRVVVRTFKVLSGVHAHLSRASAMFQP
jgi:hypothetical protein